jgi:hypothetical protein
MDLTDKHNAAPTAAKPTGSGEFRKTITVGTLGSASSWNWEHLLLLHVKYQVEHHSELDSLVDSAFYVFEPGVKVDDSRVLL